MKNKIFKIYLILMILILTTSNCYAADYTGYRKYFLDGFIADTEHSLSYSVLTSDSYPIGSGIDSIKSKNDSDGAGNWLDVTYRGEHDGNPDSNANTFYFKVPGALDPDDSEGEQDYKLVFKTTGNEYLISETGTTMMAWLDKLLQWQSPKWVYKGGEHQIYEKSGWLNLKIVGIDEVPPGESYVGEYDPENVKIILKMTVGQSLKKDFWLCAETSSAFTGRNQYDSNTKRNLFEFYYHADSKYIDTIYGTYKGKPLADAKQGGDSFPRLSTVEWLYANATTLTEEEFNAVVKSHFDSLEPDEAIRDARHICQTIKNYKNPDYTNAGVKSSTFHTTTRVNVIKTEMLDSWITAFENIVSDMENAVEGGATTTDDLLEETDFDRYLGYMRSRTMQFNRFESSWTISDGTDRIITWDEDYDVIKNTGNFKPTSITTAEQNKFAGKVGPIIVTLTNVGIVVSVILLGILGIKYMIGSIEERVEYKKDLVPYFIGAFLLLGISTFLKILQALGEAIFNL